jgi:hypothetical protein
MKSYFYGNNKRFDKWLPEEVMFFKSGIKD